MESGLSASDIALLGGNDGMNGNMGFFWIFALLLLSGGGFGFNRNGEFGQYATAASQQDILFGQKFSDLDNKMDRLGNGIADATFALNNSVTNEGRNIQSQLAECCCSNKEAIAQVRYDMAQGFASSNANTTAQIQKVLDTMAQNKIDSLQAQVNQLQFQNMMNGVVKYPTQTTYSIGMNPYCNCNGNI